METKLTEQAEAELNRWCVRYYGYHSIREKDHWWMDLVKSGDSGYCKARRFVTNGADAMDLVRKLTEDPKHWRKFRTALRNITSYSDPVDGLLFAKPCELCLAVRRAVTGHEFSAAASGERDEL